MASTELAERTYKVLYDYFMNHSENFWRKQLEIGTRSEIYADKSMRDSAEDEMFVLMLDCKEIIREETAKSRGAGNVYSVFSKTFKENAKKGREYLTYAYEEDGKTYATNSYYALRTNKKLDLPNVDNERFPRGVVDIINRTIANNLTHVNDVPTLSELKAYIKLKKAEQPKGTDVMYELDSGYSYVNAEYLKRIIEFLGDSNICCYTVWEPDKRPISPLLFINDDGDCAVLCQARKTYY